MAHLVYVVLLLFSDRLYTLDRMQSLTAAGHGFSREMCTRSSLLVSLASGGVLTPLKGVVALCHTTFPCGIGANGTYTGNKSGLQHALVPR